MSDFLYGSPVLFLKASNSQDTFIFQWMWYQYCGSKYLLCCILGVQCTSCAADLNECESFPESWVQNCVC